MFKPFGSWLFKNVYMCQETSARSLNCAMFAVLWYKGYTHPFATIDACMYPRTFRWIVPVVLVVLIVVIAAGSSSSGSSSTTVVVRLIVVLLMLIR